MRRLEARIADLEAAFPEPRDSPWDWTRVNCEELDWIDFNWNRLRARDITEAERATERRILDLALGRSTRPGLNCPGKVHDVGGYRWRTRCNRCSNRPWDCAPGTPTEGSFDASCRGADAGAA